MAKQFTLGKTERLKSRKIIEQLFSGGKSFAITPFRVYYQLGTLTVSSLQFGAGVSSKHFKKAVDRNKIKRLMREAWRLQKTALQQSLKEQNQQLHVFFIYTGREIPAYKEVYDKVEKSIQKLSVMMTAKK
ncbi:MAG: ribonuclease P protein component [Chitinophagaceae bacterium]